MSDPPAVSTPLERWRARCASLTTEQLERVEAVTARNAAIQAAGPRPADGICFGKKGGKADG